MQVPHTVSILHKVTGGGSGDSPRVYNALVHRAAFWRLSYPGPWWGREHSPCPVITSPLMPESLGKSWGRGRLYLFSKEAASEWLTGLVKSSSSGVLWETHFFFMPMILSKEQSHLLQKVRYACRRAEESRSSGKVSTGLVWVLPGILLILGWFSSDCRDVTVFHILLMELLEYPGNVPLIKSLPQLPFLVLEIKIDFSQHHHSWHGANQEILPCPGAGRPVP